ncbi:MAG: peptidase carboxypeptidase [Parcubacteria group bacterium]|nr:peptidase carboxypeptidase [Parcubacteria group bacterium]
MKGIIALIAIVALGFGAYYFTHTSPQTSATTGTTASTTQQAGSQATTTEVKTETVIGTSVQGRPITAYHYGTGDKEVVFIGDIHGGYTWNTALLGYKTVEYFKNNPTAIPKNVKVTVIPVLNPDGLNKVVGTTTANFSQADVASGQAAQIAGRFNGNTVDLNRNFDCLWQAKATWQGRTVSGGTGAFSEPESQAIKSYIETQKPIAVVAWYASAGGVYTSSCGSATSPETLALTNLYAKAAGYTSNTTYTADPLPGDMTNWLAKIGIPAISVMLKTHTDMEWGANQAGIDAVLARYAK